MSGAAEVTAPVLTARDVCVRFGGLLAVEDVTVSVGEREIVSVVGPNGAGKTTLLNAISGLVPMTGAIEVGGSATRAGDAKLLARLGLARSFQSPQLIEHENAIENVLLGAHLRAGYASWAQVFRRRHVLNRERDLVREATELLAEAELSGHDVLRPVVHLTHGMRKRIDIARAMMSRPRILLMDEPTAGMGAEERTVVEQMMLRTRDTLGTSILTVEHHMDVVRRVADRVVAMKTGAILRVGTPLEVLVSEEFMVAAVGRAAADTLKLTGDGPDRTQERR